MQFFNAAQNHEQMAMTDDQNYYHQAFGSNDSSSFLLKFSFCS